MTKVFQIVITIGMGFLIVSTIYNSCNKPIEIKAIETIQSKIDTIYKNAQEKKERLKDTLIIEKTNEKEIVNRIREINNYYSDSETNIDTIPIVINDVRSPFAKEKLREWVLREDTGYYDIPQQGYNYLP